MVKIDKNCVYVPSKYIGKVIVIRDVDGDPQDWRSTDGKVVSYHKGGGWVNHRGGAEVGKTYEIYQWKPRKHIGTATYGTKQSNSQSQTKSSNRKSKNKNKMSKSKNKNTKIVASKNFDDKAIIYIDGEKIGVMGSMFSKQYNKTFKVHGDYEMLIHFEVNKKKSNSLKLYLNDGKAYSFKLIRNVDEYSHIVREASFFRKEKRETRIKITYSFVFEK